MQSNDQASNSTENKVESMIDNTAKTPDIKSPYIPVPENKNYLDETQVLPKERVTLADLENLNEAYTNISNDIIAKIKEEKTDTINELKTLGATIDTSLKGIYKIVDQVFINGEYTEFFDRDGLTQTVYGENQRPISVRYPKINPSLMSGNLSGDIASAVIRKKLHGSDTVTIPLWHSGIILTVNPIPKKDILLLTTNLLGLRNKIGRNTRGAVFSSEDVAIHMAIVNKALSLLVSTNLKEQKIDLLNLIKVPDLQLLYAGLLAGLYPTGYPIVKACTQLTSNGTPCSFVYKSRFKEDGEYYPSDLLDFTLLTWVDQKDLTIQDKLHMSAKPGTHSVDDILAYQDRVKMYTVGLNDPVVIWKEDNTSMKILFDVPNITEYEQSSALYKTAVTDLFDKATISNERRQGQIMSGFSAILKLCKHLAWIKEIIIEDYDQASETTTVSTISNKQDIFAQLEALSSIDNIDELLEKELNAFKSKATIAACGIPNYACPSCGKGQLTETDTPYTSLIPLNMVGYFFTTSHLYTLRVQNQS